MPRDAQVIRTGTVLPFIDGSQACADEDPELFFAPDGARGVAKEAREEDAKAICARCPLVRPCLAHALTNAEWGVWGGTSEDEREALQHRHGLPRRIASLQNRERPTDDPPDEKD